MLRQVLHRKRRRERQMCGYDGCPVKTGDAYYC